MTEGETHARVESAPTDKNAHKPNVTQNDEKGEIKEERRQISFKTQISII